MGTGGDLHLALTRSHRLHEYEVHPHRVEDANRIEGREGEAAGVSTRRHGPNEHSGIRPRLCHANPIPQDSAPCVGRCGIDGDDAHSAIACPEGADEAIDQGALAHARRPREADDMRSARPWMDVHEGLRCFGFVVLDERYQLRGRALVAGDQIVHEAPDAVGSALPGSPLRAQGHSLTRLWMLFGRK